MTQHCSFFCLFASLCLLCRDFLTFSDFEPGSTRLAINWGSSCGNSINFSPLCVVCVNKGIPLQKDLMRTYSNLSIRENGIKIMISRIMMIVLINYLRDLHYSFLCGAADGFYCLRMSPRCASLLRKPENWNVKTWKKNCKNIFHVCPVFFANWPFQRKTSIPDVK